MLLYRAVKISGVLESYLASLREVSEEGIGIEAGRGQREKFRKLFCCGLAVPRRLVGGEAIE
jgi:hypothetical protein